MPPRPQAWADGSVAGFRHRDTMLINPVFRAQSAKKVSKILLRG